ncbi:MAG: bifunctional [glutamate--ammonia ligase]-adenylyl-L-tyrosine phosphorylase/[glutamate--ammonia-ligase] adenylyltransferase [Nevskiaceae bacterium]|nr:MAG: bifunctional [glutamate--ammonia ligase]-adenylyl-L-tyrosine phosphorylase/[glutamate--ammonia-ligase] adenylyltransferase [Nevskiaceae bacterium]
MTEAAETPLAIFQRLRPALGDAARKVFAASLFAREAGERDLTELPDWIESGLFEQRRAEGDTVRVVAAACADAADEAALMRALRRLRRREMLRIAFRDLALLAPLDETLRDLSELADACCEQALHFAARALQARWGVPRDGSGTEARPVVLGMGKLGGHELNFSSDIDLIFCYTAGGDTREGPRSVSNEEYFNRLAQDTARILSARTEDGFVFRVDTMLRPFGSAGAPAWSVSAMEDYYQVHGREWERYAFIKARPIAGDLEAGRSLLRALRPFVYRRYLDYSAIVSLRALKKLISDEVKRKGMEQNIKLGAGGIREIEFIVQSFQLVRGGQEAPLRDARLRPVLRYLAQAGHLGGDIALALDQAYVFLRRLENAIQIYADEQTHALPASEAARAALCTALDFPDWPSLMLQLDAMRALVVREFERVFGEPEAPRKPADDELTSVIAPIWNGLVTAEEAAASLQAAGFGDDAAAIATALRDLKHARLVRAMQEATVLRLLSLLTPLFEECRRQPYPSQAALRALQVLAAIAGRANYITLLHESATARTQLVQLCAASPWLTDLLAQTPALLDHLLDPRSLYAPPERAEMAQELAARCAHFGPGDTEAAMDLLRRYQKEITLRVAAADVMHALPLVKISDRLTWLAEVIVARALEFAWAEMRAQYGQPLRADGTPASFLVVAYGKFGGIEMGYTSDLDLVFLHDCDALDEESVDGPRAINNAVYFSRLAQRLINWLATQTPAGRAYEIDMELRPNGNSGALVTSLAGFADYQRHHAWTWEHQALTRARPVAGDAVLAEAFKAIRAEVLTQPRDETLLRRDIIDMRAKMRANLEKKVPGKWDVKQGEGGMVEVEFITQFLVLRDAHKDPALVEWSDNWRQLDALERAGSVTAMQKSVLIDSYRAYRAWAHKRGLQLASAMAPLEEFEHERASIAQVWSCFFK